MVGRESQVWPHVYHLVYWISDGFMHLESKRIGRNSIKMFILFHRFYSLGFGFEYYIYYVFLHNKLPQNVAS